ncbi:MAG: hypothetical protein HGB26_09210, partial [Desulfobulbaceae bacterium]|nr:hypothetical protein [Desulfobulbaceae bacterium]
MLPAIGRSNQEIFFELLNGASLFFFAWSGISYASGIPSAYTFLKTATSAIFPGLSDKELEILSGVQPEIFYESLLAYVPSEVALQPWMALHPNVASRFGSPPKPNLVHFELVRYSSTNSIPIFTTNFDTLFEDAAAILGLHCTVLLPDALPKFPSTGATICKLHGSISDNCGRPSIDNLYTTMSAITRSNNTWIEALTRLMDRKHICFVGYSGRDLDLFPFIESYTKRSTTREPIWINQTFFNDPSEGPSVRCGAIRLSGLFPYDLFKEIGAVEPSVSAVTQTNFIIGKKGTELALTSLACDFATKSKLTIVDRETLRIQLHAKLGRYSFAHDLLQSDSSIML